MNQDTRPISEQPVPQPDADKVTPTLPESGELPEQSRGDGERSVEDWEEEFSSEWETRPEPGESAPEPVEQEEIPEWEERYEPGWEAQPEAFAKALPEEPAGAEAPVWDEEIPEEDVPVPEQEADAEPAAPEAEAPEEPEESEELEEPEQPERPEPAQPAVHAANVPEVNLPEAETGHAQMPDVAQVATAGEMSSRQLQSAVRRAARSGQERQSAAWRVRIAAALIMVGLLLAAYVGVFAYRAGRAEEEPESVSESVPPASSVPEEPEDDPLSPADPDLWSLMLANTEHPLPEGYEPQLANTGNGQYVDERILEPLRELFAAAEEDGIYLYVRSAYRSEETQRTLFYQLQAEYEAMGYSSEDAYALAKMLRNLPGTSEHQTGLAVDIVSAYAPGVNLVDSLAETDWAKWLLENAADYGFILRYPEGKTDITGTSFEPWHYRYVGVEDAQKIMAAGLCLEEYLGVAEKAPASSSSTTSSTPASSSSSAVSSSSASSSQAPSQEESAS